MRAVIVSMLALATLGLLAWGNPGKLWARAFAQPCPAAVPASDCVTTLPARIASRWDSVGEGETVLALDIQNAPADTPMSFGHAHAFPTLSDADRLGVAGGDTVRVTLFGTEVIAVTTDDGRTAEIGVSKGGALFRLLAMAAAVLIATGVASVLLRRRRRSAEAAVGAPELAGPGGGGDDERG